MHPKYQIDFVKLKVFNKQQPYYDAYHQLISHADAAFNHTTHALADFAVPGYYVHAEMHQKNSAGLQSDAFDAYACALAYHISGDQSKYADQSLRFLKSWADLNTKYSDADGSLVMAYSGTAMVMAGELLLNYNGWAHVDKQKYLIWVQNVYLKASNEIRLRKNNWADWGRLGSILSAHLLDNPQETAENIRLIKSDLFHKIANDGHMPKETARGANGIWYTYFSLAPITAACWIAYQSTGENLFTNYTQGNSSIKQALDYLYYYNLHPNEWQWFVNPNRGTPGSWPGNLLEAMSSIYGDNRYADYAKPARPISYSKHHFAWAFPTLMKVQLGDMH
ncbi:unnamed protein product [Didymodactylos carnosus]|uniref:Alginate lyase domain-containing protein n=1 Tax=Didymodactylos carnosus TaxID=1234261 RepID=A0A815BCM2_9BILA|nr:unnamed protein product [Didymodactylos carnosus]CAF1427316.1 unnamed protein product [Didymodactylos carnosus]CAF4058605.1 unnamed protein product [Didymodactylos carnosus]CAF4226159.1 unnamed protein product [Didymodactylos carnosus]